MAFENEFASGLSLLHLGKSKTLLDFEASIRKAAYVQGETIEPVQVPRSGWMPRKVIAIDASTVTKAVQNGFPTAELTLMLLSVVFIDLKRVHTAMGKKDEIPSPRVFNEMDEACTLDAVLPGANIVRTDRDELPVEFFREVVFDTLNGRLDKDGETLLETLRAIAPGYESKTVCPRSGCSEQLAKGTGKYVCGCEHRYSLFESDALRFHQRFNDVGSNGEVHGEVRHVLETLALVNVLRYFADPSRIGFLKECAFILDGPLAVFGQPAWLKPYVQAELIRINRLAVQHNGSDILVMGLEKSGAFMQHLHDIDFTQSEGERTKYPKGSALIPSKEYIAKNIVFSPEGAKPYGEITYYGRKIFYKTKVGDHAVLNAAIVVDSMAASKAIAADNVPRLGDMLDILDSLRTYLYRDGFMPLIRAHAHAAIPLSRGTAILESLVRKEAA